MNKRSGEETRQLILKAALAVFSGSGYAEASMRTIATAAGISVGALYLYFRSKEELYATILSSYMEELNRLTEPLLRARSNPADGLADFIIATTEFARSRREIILLIGKETGSEASSGLKREFFVRRRLMIEEIVRDGVARGVFRECDPAEAAKVIFCTLRGYIISLMVEEEALFEPRECAALLLRGLVVRRDEQPEG